MSIPSAQRKARNPLAAVADFVSDRSAFVLALILLEVGLVAGVWQAASRLYDAGSIAHTRGAAPATCAQAAVTFRREATERDITMTLIQYGASITYGPDENGAYLVQLPNGEAGSSALAGLASSQVVGSFSPERVCR